MALDADCYNGLEKQRKEQAVQVLQKWSRSLRVKRLLQTFNCYCFKYDTVCKWWLSWAINFKPFSWYEVLKTAIFSIISSLFADQISMLYVDAICFHGWTKKVPITIKMSKCKYWSEIDLHVFWIKSAISPPQSYSCVKVYGFYHVAMQFHFDSKFWLVFWLKCHLVSITF